MTKAVLIKATGEASTVILPDENSYSALKEMVGGWLDAVTVDEMTMYVHDEGLLIGLEPNVTASLLTNRVIVGDVVIVGNTSPSGKCDGADYDAPEKFLTGAFRLLSLVYNTDEQKVATVKQAQEEMMSQPLHRVYSMNDEGEWAEH